MAGYPDAANLDAGSTFAIRPGLLEKDEHGEIRHATGCPKRGRRVVVLEALEMEHTLRLQLVNLVHRSGSLL
jgi:hypothetical protein